MANLREQVEEYNMDRCLQLMPYEILFEIFRSLPKEKLIEISKLCSRFKDVVGDTRLWTNVRIIYRRTDWQESDTILSTVFDIEELYAEPWPVKEINLSSVKVNPPVSSDIGRVVKVKTLNLSSITANKAALETILAKYQCKELSMNYCDNTECDIMRISPRVFSKQTALEALNLQSTILDQPTDQIPFLAWLGKVLRNCKNMKTLDLSHNQFYNYGMLDFVKKLPASLERLNLDHLFDSSSVEHSFFEHSFVEHSFFDYLPQSTPNLKELVVSRKNASRPSLLQLQFLETLHIYTRRSERSPDNLKNSDLYMHLIKFPVLKTIYTRFMDYDLHVQFRMTLEIHGISVVKSKAAQDWSDEGSDDEELENPFAEQSCREDELWEVKKAPCAY